MNLSKELAKQAKKMGACKEGHDELLLLQDKDAMVELYLRKIDFCLSKEYPDNNFIRSNFKVVMEKQGVFLDKCVCLGGCSGNVMVDGFNVCEVFAKHNSEIIISAKESAFVMVDVFDDSIVTIHAHDRTKVCVNRYGGVVNLFADDESIVKIREKNKKTY